MRLSLLLFTLSTIAWLTSSQAQMFATIQDCDKRYGKAVPPTNETSDVRFYRQGDLLVKILFVEEKATVITFTSAGKKIENATRKTLLDANAGGKSWEEIEGDGPKTWRRSDGLAFASYDSTVGELNIFSTDYIEKAKAEVQTVANKP